jgi:hypothetical protein
MPDSLRHTKITAPGHPLEFKRDDFSLKIFQIFSFFTLSKLIQK